MELIYRQLRLGERHELAACGSGRLELIVGSGRAVSATIAEGGSLWLALRGELPLDTSDGQIVLRPGQMLVSPEASVGNALRGRGLWLVLAGPAVAWQRCLSAVLPQSEQGEPWLYPQLASCPAELRQLLFGLLRSVRTGEDTASQELLLIATSAALRSAQGSLREMAERCAGRTRRRRRQNLLRLLRVRQRILMNPNTRLELSVLAAQANYSQWHFIRAFRDVFGEAPCEYANRIRLEHARHLIVAGDLTVSEVAGLVGYDSRSAFCRSFRQAFGITASEARSASRPTRLARAPATRSGLLGTRSVA